MAAIRKGYSDGPFGQLHWRMMEASGKATQPDLYCMHPAPFSGLAYSTIMPLLAANRRVIAPDYPGYGGSDAFKEHPSIAEYALAMMAVVDKNSEGKAVDLIGFHTGNLVAGEMAILKPQQIGKLVLVDVPAFDTEIRAKYRKMAAQPFNVSDDKDCLDQPWRRGITNRLETQGPARALEMFAEQLRAGRNMHAAFDAAFTYNAYGRMPLIQHPTLVLASQSELLEATRWTAGNIAGATLVERLDITTGVLDQEAAKTAREIMAFLDQD